MSLLPFFSSSERAPRLSKKKKTKNLMIEALEDRSVPSATGFGTPPSPGDLTDVAGAGGQQNNVGAVTKTVTFASTPTDFSLQGLLDQFDPSLGTLQSIDITHTGSITSQIQVENTSTTSTSHISGTVSGNLALQGPGGLADNLSLSQYAGSFDAAKYDSSTDYQGASGTSFGIKTANGSDNLSLTGNQLTPYIGTGQVRLTESAQATSNATGGGNLNTEITSTGQATLTVVYNYLKQQGVLSGFVYHDNNNDGLFQSAEQGIGNVTISLTGSTINGAVVNQTTTTDSSTGAYQFTGLSAGSYTVTETQPANWIDGKTTAGTLGGSATDNVISQISLPQNGQSLANNFGELLGSSIAGNVYYDVQHAGSLQPGDPAIPGTTVTLTGNGVNLTTSTDANGHYAFTGLLPGNYTINEAQPAGYTQGTDSVGSAGGNLSGDQVSNIGLPDATQAGGYNFGELKPSSLSGYVFVDPNNNCDKDPGEQGIPGVTVTLTGTDDANNSVTRTTQTNPLGQFQFSNLAPGNYTVAETQPTAYQDGQTCAGSLGGVATDNVISNIHVPMGVDGTDYHFAELLPPQTYDLAIVKTASAQVSNYADLLTYTLHITNNGPNDAQAVVVTDQLPGDVQITQIVAPGWGIGAAGATLTLALPSLAAGASSDVFVTVRVPSTTESLTNSSSVTSQTPDNNPNNNHSQVTTTVQAPPGNTGSQGTPVGQNITPLATHLALPPVVSKYQLFTDTATLPADPQTKAMYSFVDGVYQTLLGQSAADVTEQANVKQLQNGMTRQELIYDIWNSTAHLTRQVNSIYQSILNRAPTAAELSMQVAALRGNQAINLTQQLLTSAEFQQLHPSSASMSIALSQTLLGQNPGTTDAQTLAQSLDAQPLNAMVQSMLYSQAGLAQMIATAYAQTLRRQATSAEIAYWSAQLASGATSVEGMSETLLASSEFYQLAYNSAA
jgi:uncharacterized repeat protein (TIGR01451 family)